MVFLESKLHLVLPYRSCGTGCRYSAWKSAKGMEPLFSQCTWLNENHSGVMTAVIKWGVLIGHWKLLIAKLQQRRLVSWTSPGSTWHLLCKNQLNYPGWISPNTACYDQCHLRESDSQRMGWLDISPSMRHHEQKLLDSVCKEKVEAHLRRSQPTEAPSRSHHLTGASEEIFSRPWHGIRKSRLKYIIEKQILPLFSPPVTPHSQGWD